MIVAHLEYHTFVKRQVQTPIQEFLHGVFLDPNDIEFIPPYFPDDPVIRLDMATNYSNLVRMDKEVGKIISELKEQGLYDDAYIFFYSDHGTGLPRHKRWLFDTGVKVPFIIYIPEQFKELYPAKPGSKINQLVSFIAVSYTHLTLPTILLV